MNLINFKDIDFNQSIDNSTEIIEFNGSQIQVLKYLPLDEQYDLVMITLQKSFENGIYNTVKLQKFLELNLVYSYTNIVFDEEDRADEAKLYDTLCKSGLMEKVLEVIGVDQILVYRAQLEEMVKTIMKYRNTFGAVLNSFINDLPKNMEAAKELVDQFNPEQYKMILDLAKNIKMGNLN